jgi:glutamyl-tRNA synthetase
LNGEYLRDLSDERFHVLAVHALARAGIDTNRYPLEYVKAALDTCKGKVKVFEELAAYAGFYFKDDVVYDAEAIAREFTPENKARLARLRDAFGKLTAFEAEAIGATLAATAKELSVKNGVLVHPTRLACTGNASGPSLYHLIAILGKELTLKRLDQALQRM